jgi:hypothetical protein
MIWKKLRTGGPSGLVELILVATGVFLALAVDGWNDSRLDRVEEAGYLDRISAELEDDTTDFNFILGSIDSKEASLLRLRSLLESWDPIPPDSSQFLADLGQSANFGWNVEPLTRSASFEDLRSSGNLGLIRDPALRLALVRYYADAEGEDRRMEARKTAYPIIAYRSGLFPHSTRGRWRSRGLREGGNDSVGLSRWAVGGAMGIESPALG